MKQWNLAGKTALITGASKGIGKTIAEEFLSLGARLIIVSRNKEEIEELAAQWRSEGHPVTAVAADVTKTADREKIRAIVEANYDSSLDILVNNAATTIRRNAEDYEENEYRHVIDTNVYGLFEMCRLCLPWLKNSRYQAAIINLASVAGLVDVQSGAPYGMSKAAIIQLTRNLASEWSKFNIRVNAVSPWYTDTPLAAPVLNNPEKLDRILSRTPLSRVAQPEEVAGAVAFLAMDKAAYITGQNIAVDGGFLIKGL